MRSPQPLTNGATETPLSPLPQIHAAAFHSTLSVRKLQRFNTLILAFRFASFCFSFAAAVFMITNSHGSNSPRWSDFDAFRFVVAANAIVVIYSLFQMGASIWEIYAGATLFPEFIQVWFDFGHDQAFAYLLLSASSAGMELGRTLREMDTCMANRAFCVQSGIAVGLGFAGFLLVGLSSMLSGFRVVCLTINGSRFHI